MLVNGVWSKNWEPVQNKDEEGRFLRQSSSFRQRLDGANYTSESLKDRFRLYVALICPWATRTLIARSLLGLEEVLPVCITKPFITDLGWEFGNYKGSHTKHDAGVSHIHELYTQSDKTYTGRATVPVLWDSIDNKIINNESGDILKILNDDLKSLHTKNINLRPDHLLDNIEVFNTRIYSALNNGVYRSGFASTQQAYEEANQEIFECLNELEAHFSHSLFAVGEQLTESDIRLFVTLIRFDIAYYGLFKTNIRRIADYQHLSEYLERMLDIPSFNSNTNVSHIKEGYHSVKALNPLGIVSTGPKLRWMSKVSV